jgi:RimJ/RimL family protein N-acetyltransferase
VAFELRSADVVLREGREDDAPALAQGFVEDPAMGMLIGAERDPDEARLREQLSRPVALAGPHFTLVIADPATDAALGTVIVHSIDATHRRGEVGFYLVPGARGRGLAAAAVRLVVDWLFDERGLDRVEMTTTPDNARVPALARRLGFTQEGVLRARNLERGRRVDVVWYGLLRDER